MLIAVPTKNRTAAFRRCLESIKRNAIIYDHDIEFLVVDDSDDGSNVANREVLESLNVPFRYYHRGDVAAFAGYLSRKAECAPELTRFLFARTAAAHGAVRNFLTLMAGGQPVIMVDDDMICKFANVEHSDSFEQQFSDYVIHPPTKIVDVVNKENLVDVDFISKHEEMLKWVPLSIGGAIGDSGVPHSYIFLRSPDILLQLAIDPEVMLAKMHRRQILRCAKNPTIVNWCCCVGMSFALDTAQLLPPYFPVGRGEDVLFGEMVQQCVGKNAGYVPYAMWHTPVREDSEEGLPVLGSTWEPTFMHKLLYECNPDSFLMFGETLMVLSGQDLSWVEPKHRHMYIKRLNTSHQGLQLPELLVHEVGRYKDVILNAPPYEVPYNSVKQFGELLVTWPKIYEVAQDYGKLQVCLRSSTV